MNKFNYTNLTPFKWFVLENFPFIEADFDALTNYQLFCKLGKEINKIIDSQNLVGEQAETLTNAFNNLKNYVDNYFDNLDVQDEINNKLNEMVESGEFSNILAELIYTLKVYDNIDKMKNDETLINGQKVFCFGYTTAGDIGKGYYYITNQTLEENNLTIIKLNNGLYAKLLYTDTIYVADVNILTTELITYLLNNNIKIITKEPIPITETIQITSDNVTIKDLKLIGNTDSPIFLLEIKGNNIKIENSFFTGNAGNYIRVNGASNVVINNNTFNCINYRTTSPVVFISANHSIFTNNILIDNSGFNVQTLFSTNINISNNSFNNTVVKRSYTAIGGEQNIQFIVPYNPERYILKINDVKSNAFTTEYNKETKQLTINFNSALVSGDVITYRGYKSLECLNINSKSYNINIEGNIINGTGDSGIVLGSDYHNNVLDPSNVTPDDYPRRVTVSNNTITNCAFAGIAFTHNVELATITNNVISNCGWLDNSIYSSGIFTPIGKKTISNNTISNIYNEDNEENGIMKYGICIQPLDVISTADTEKYLDIKNKILIYHNSISNVETRIKTFPFSNFGVLLGIDMDSSKYIELPEINNITSSEGIFELFGTGSCSLDTNEKVDDLNSMKVTLSTATDQYFCFNNSVINNITNAKIKISFFAKASDENKIMTILYSSSIGFKQNLVCQKLTTDWNLYQMEIFISDKPTIFQFRATNLNNSSGNIWISHIKYSIQNIND